MSQQYRGSAVDIVYSHESLREIFVNNIQLVKADRMVLPELARTKQLEAFLGRNSRPIFDSSARLGGMPALFRWPADLNRAYCRLSVALVDG